MIFVQSPHQCPDHKFGVIRIAAVILLHVVGVASIAAAQESLPAAVYTGPPTDKAHPAKLTVLRIPSHGAFINGLAYLPSGGGLHPTVVICHGLPGNEKSLDLAEALRRAGWNAVTFNYRGSWGSEGECRFRQTLEDAAAVLVYLRDPANVTSLGVDISRIVLVGHIMGAWVVAHTVANDHAIAAAILISAADFGLLGGLPRDQLVSFMTGELTSLKSVTAEGMADEVRANAKSFRLESEAAGLIQTPLLALSSDEFFAPDTDALVRDIKAKEETRSAHCRLTPIIAGRIAESLQSEVIKMADADTSDALRAYLAETCLHGQKVCNELSTTLV
jgi:uncharacterized protein